MLLWQKQFLLRAPDGRTVRGHGKVQAQNEKEFVQLSIREMPKRAKRCLMRDHGRWTEIPACGGAGAFAATCKTQDERLVFVITDEAGRMLAAGETEPPLLQWQPIEQELEGWFQAEREKRRADRRTASRQMPQNTLQPKENVQPDTSPICTDGPVERKPIQKETPAEACASEGEPTQPHAQNEPKTSGMDASALLQPDERTESKRALLSMDSQACSAESRREEPPSEGTFHTVIEPQPDRQTERVQGPVLPGQWQWQRVESTAAFSYLLGQLPDESGAPKAVAVAIPGEYAPAPPAYLQGFTFHRQGYWVLVQDAKTGRVMERVG